MMARSVPDGHINESYLTEQNFQDYKDAGFTYLISEWSASYHDLDHFQNTTMKTYMDLAEKVGIPVVLDAPYLTSVCNGEYEFNDTTKTFIDYMLCTLKDYKMFKGIMLKDEPSSEQATSMKAILDYAWTKQPGLYHFSSMQPIYAKSFKVNNVLDENLYKQYIRTMADATGSFAYGNYPLYWEPSLGTSVRDDYYQNYELVAQDAKEHKYDTGMVVQSSSWGNYGQEATTKHVRKTNSKSDISFQVYSALAYGAKHINYYTYWEHVDQYTGGFVYDAMVMFPTEEGQEPIKTDTYYAVQAMNLELKKFDHIFLEYDWEGCMAFTASNKSKSAMLSHVEEYQSERINSVTASDETLVGCMKDEKGNDGFWIVNATDPGKKLSNSVTITFKNATSAICYIKGEEKKVKLINGSCTFYLEPGEGVFVVPVE